MQFDGNVGYHSLPASGRTSTPAGHILINTNFEETVPLLRQSIEKLGFQLTDIRIILGSHAHGDHMQADAMVKEAGKYKRLGAATNPYIDPAGYKAWVDNMDRNLTTMLAEQRKAAPSN